MFDYDSIYEKAIYCNCRINKLNRLGKIISIIFGALLRLIYPCDISSFATLEKNVQIPHATGIVIGGTAVIGSNVVIMPGVVIGARNYPHKGKAKRHATIKGGTFIGANAVILGDITIGENSIIGGGAVVTKDVPPNSKVLCFNEIINEDKVES